MTTGVIAKESGLPSIRCGSSERFCWSFKRKVNSEHLGDIVTFLASFYASSLLLCFSLLLQLGSSYACSWLLSVMLKAELTLLWCQLLGDGDWRLEK